MSVERLWLVYMCVCVCVCLLTVLEPDWSHLCVVDDICWLHKYTNSFYSMKKIHSLKSFSQEDQDYLLNNQ